MQSRREFIAQAALATAASLAGAGGCATVGSRKEATRRPNVVLIITDDQGYGDFHCHGNDFVRTPNLDRLHDESVRFTQCYVSPVCSPTRSSLMTGRYNYRTGIVDTFQGRSMMYPDEVTIAEALSGHGYRTAIFGKWHLGDNYPMRPIDQGFEEALVHKGGGICQPSEPANNSYFDPVLQHNGMPEKRIGYCSDIFGNAAIEFIRQHAADPFFVYLAFNAPHSPLIVGEKYSDPYRAMGLDEKTAKTYGMISNLDENAGRLLDTLRELRIEEDTLVVFLTDNGAAIGDGERRFNAGFRGVKGTVYEGGIHVPCFMRRLGTFQPGKEIDRVVAHIDIFPTILEACRVPAPRDVRLDGLSLMPIIAARMPVHNTGAGNAVSQRSDFAQAFTDRTLYFQWHRGDAPELYRNCAARSQRYKLVDGKELYDIPADPGEKNDIAEKHPDIVAEMRRGYEEWFRSVGGTRGYDPPRICIGTTHENPSVLTRQDWRGSESWHDGNVGHWEVKVARSARITDRHTGGAYDILLTFPEAHASGVACFMFNDVSLEQPIQQGATTCLLHAVRLKAGDGQLHAYTQTEGKRAGVTLASVERLQSGFFPNEATRLLRTLQSCAVQ